jgi:hypothetical protein
VIRDDWFLRQLHAAIEAIARAFTNLAAGDVELAETDIEDAYAVLLGPNRPLLGVVDTETLARLLGSPDAVRALARASDADAALRRTTGDEAGAGRCAERALALYATLPEGATEG